MVTAVSGHAKDIQDAVDKAAAEHEREVSLPKGSFDLYEIGETWTPVNIDLSLFPIGINFFGSPTQRDAKDQVIEWETLLKMPEEAPTGRSWFRYIIDPTSETNRLRFSDIKLQGYRFLDPSSPTMYTGIEVYVPGFQEYPTAGMRDFRIDHSAFQDLCGNAIWVLGGYNALHSRRVASGVIDHCRLVNSYGDPGWADYSARTLDYGIGMRRWVCDLWDPEITNILGRYNNYTIFIEDNYFSKWRHCTASNDGIHQVVRHNVFEGCYGIAEVDGHGSYADDSYPYAVGTRAIEVYNNIFRNPDLAWYDRPWAINLRGGSGIIFDNILEGYYGLLDFNNDWGNYEPYCPQCLINQTYIWNNNLGGGRLIHYNADSVENVNYFLRAPNLAQDGFDYTSYPYPHPLTQPTPISPIKLIPVTIGTVGGSIIGYLVGGKKGAAIGAGLGAALGQIFG